jgi:protein-tyrosine kinase
MDNQITQKLFPIDQNTSEWEPPNQLPSPSPSFPEPSTSTPRKARPTRKRKVSKRDRASANLVRSQCRQLCVSTFFRQQAPVRSLGFTSSVNGEGKSVLASITAQVLAQDSSDPVILLECDWQHPELAEIFGCPARPGLAEWLRGECALTAIRHVVAENLTFIPAGNGEHDAVRLLRRLQHQGFSRLSGSTTSLLIVDLPAIISTPYGALAASLVESLVVVAYAGVTPAGVIEQTCTQLKGLPVQGMVLNQMRSRIPRWIEQLL